VAKQRAHETEAGWRQRLLNNARWRWQKPAAKSYVRGRGRGRDSTAEAGGSTAEAGGGRLRR
jgi:hypothetical protein